MTQSLSRKPKGDLKIWMCEVYSAFPMNTQPRPLDRTPESPEPCRIHQLLHDPKIMLRRREVLRVGLIAATTICPALSDAQQDVDNPNTHVLEFSSMHRSRVLLSSMPLITGKGMPSFTVEARVTPSKASKSEMAIFSSYQNNQGMFLRIFKMTIGLNRQEDTKPHPIAPHPSHP
jgi:hypothetical protein